MTRPITTPTDDDLIRDSFRTRHDADNNRTVIEVELTHWPHPHEPESEWIEVSELPSTVTPEEVGEAVIKVLRRRRFFKVCSECGKRFHSGYMYDRVTCYGCAEEKYGVVY